MWFGVLSVLRNNPHHTVAVGQISPPLLRPYLPFSFFTTLSPVFPAAAPHHASFWLGPLLLHFSWVAPRRPQVSASVSRPGNANFPTEGRGVELLSSLLWNKLAAWPSACYATPSDWILEWQHRGLEWPDTGEGCCWVTAEECQQPRLLQLVFSAGLPVCVCSSVSLVAAAEQPTVSSDILNWSAM